MNFNSISLSIPEIKGLDKQTDRQTDGWTSTDLIRIPFILKKIRNPKMGRIYIVSIFKELFLTNDGKIF